MVIKHGQCTGSSCEPWGSLQRGSHSGGTRIGVVSQNVHISCKGGATREAPRSGERALKLKGEFREAANGSLELRLLSARKHHTVRDHSGALVSSPVPAPILCMSRNLST
jgi:hypothetical protein